jgi:hypothetical protein
MATDESWADLARVTRECLALLGHPVEPRCLPDEARPCGGSFAVHCAAYFGVIAAITDHQLQHLGPDYVATAREVADHQTADLAAACLD